MKIAKWIAFGITVLSGVICLGSCLAPMVIGRLFFDKASAIGIIGGADGPTSIFVIKSSAPIFAVPCVFAASLLAWLFFRQKSKKSVRDERKTNSGAEGR